MIVYHVLWFLTFCSCKKSPAGPRGPFFIVQGEQLHLGVGGAGRGGGDKGNWPENMIIYDHIWSYMSIYDDIWSYVIIYDHIWSCRIIYDHIWSYLLIYNHIWSYMIICDHVWPFIPTPPLVTSPLPLPHPQVKMFTLTKSAQNDEIQFSLAKLCS